MTGAALLGRLRGIAAFAWDFVVGDDWRLALGVVIALALTALVADQGVSAWWLAPLFAVALLTVSVWRASGPPH